MFIRPKNTTKRLQMLATYILNFLSKNLFLDGQKVAALRMQNATDPVATLGELAKILQDQRIETIRDYSSEIKMTEEKGVIDNGI